MSEPLEQWDPAWNEADPRITTLKTEVYNLRNQMTTINSTPSTTFVIDKMNEAKEEINDRIDTLSTEIGLLQLYILGKITAAEMGSLLRMLKSVDEQNHVVAHETINNLIKEAL